MHRFVWDLRYAPPAALNHEYPIAAIYRNTPRVPLGTLVTPGRYTVVLHAGGKTLSQPLTVVMDPRIKTSIQELTEQKLVSQRLSDMMRTDAEVLSQVRELQTVFSAHSKVSAPDAVKTELNSAREELNTLTGSPRSGAGIRRVGSAVDLAVLNRELSRVFWNSARI